MSNTRDLTYGHFGPIQTEARDLVLMKMINELRVNQGLPEISEQEFRDFLMNDTLHLPPYGWMENLPGP